MSKENFIRIHKLANAEPGFTPSIEEATKLAMADPSAGYMGYQNGYFYIVWLEAWGLISHPLEMWFSDRITTYLNEKGKPIILRMPHYGIVCDLRTPEDGFLPMSPCPYCGAENNKGHNDWKHVDSFLGTPQDGYQFNKEIIR